MTAHLCDSKENDIVSNIQKVIKICFNLIANLAINQFQKKILIKKKGKWRKYSKYDVISRYINLILLIKLKFNISNKMYQWRLDFENINKKASNNFKFKISYNHFFAIFEFFQKFLFLDKKLYFEGFRLGFSNWKVKLSILGNLQLLNQSLVF